VLSAKGALYVTRPTLFHYVSTREELTMRASWLFAMIERGELDVRVHGKYPLADAAPVHALLESRNTSGKLLLIP
jgi:NADPH2:quinone reductase